MGLIDIHSHILPQIDDGAKNLEQSKKLLQILKNQGFNYVVATPHFYPMETTLDDFLKQREESYRVLQSAIDGADLPEIYLGAEVYYYSGIGKSELIKTLSIENTDYLLLELPLDNISDFLINDIKDLKENLGLVPIIAHIERYTKFKKFKQVLKLIETGVCLAQVNTSSLLKKPLSITTKKLLKKGYIAFLASDAHSTEHRPPRFDEALLEIQTTLDSDIYQNIMKNYDMISEQILNGKNDEE